MWSFMELFRPIFPLQVNKQKIYYTDLEFFYWLSTKFQNSKKDVVEFRNNILKQIMLTSEYCMNENIKFDYILLGLLKTIKFCLPTVAKEFLELEYKKPCPT